MQPTTQDRSNTDTPRTFDDIVPANSVINRIAFMLLSITCIASLCVMIAALWTLYPSVLAGFISPTIMPWLTLTFTAPISYCLLGGCVLTLGIAATYKLLTATPSERSQKIYRAGQVLMHLSGISVAAFTAGAFVEPVSTLLAPIGPYAILVTLAIFTLASYAWYRLYTGDSTVQSTGMLRWWKRQFYTPKAYACQRAIEKFDAAAEKANLESNHRDTLRKDYLLMWRAKEAALAYIPTGMEAVCSVDIPPDLTPEEKAIFQSVFSESDDFEAKIQALAQAIIDAQPSNNWVDFIETNKHLDRLTKQLRALQASHPGDEALLDRLWTPLQKYDTQKDEKGIKFLAKFTRALGLTNAAVANSTGNAFGLIGIALTFPILHLTSIPVFLKAALVFWGLLVGFFAAAALTSNSMVTNAKKLYRSRNTQASSKRDPIRKIATGVTLFFATCTACCLAAFNYQAASLLSLKISIYLGIGTLPVAISQILGIIAAALTVVAAGSFFLSFALGKLKPQQKDETFIAQISRYLKEHLFTWKPSKSHILSLTCTSICTFATTTMLFDAITAPAGIIAQIVGAQASIGIGYAMIVPCAYLLLMLFDEGFNAWPFKPNQTQGPGKQLTLMLQKKTETKFAHTQAKAVPVRGSTPPAQLEAEQTTEIEARA